MKDRLFIDTNLWVYYLLDDSIHINKRNKLVAFLNSRSDIFVINTQVINELYVTFQKLKVKVEMIETHLDLLLKNVQLIVVDELQIRKTWQIKNRYNFSYWDSLMVSSAIAANCSWLYSEDLQHGQIIEKSLTIINPLKEVV